MIAFDGNGEPYEVMPADESLQCARELLERLEGAKLTPQEPIEGGKCQDCEHEVAVRWRYGALEVCRRCVLLRMDAVKAAVDEPGGLDVSERGFPQATPTRSWFRRRRRPAA